MFRGAEFDSRMGGNLNLSSSPGTNRLWLGSAENKAGKISGQIHQI
jgi:hypothetical protein